jgi:aminoglycoside phosphotransferase (APT) family kinase protein
MADTLVAPNVRDLEELAGQLARWLGGRLPQAAEFRLHDFAYPSGAGMSHETILFDASWHDARGPVTQGFVVRVKPVANQVFVDDLFDRQFRVQRLMFEKQWLPVAEPLWFEGDAGVIGAPFFIMRKLRGRVPVSRPPYAESGWIAEASPALRRKLWENGVRMLANVARIPLAEVQFLSGPEGARSGLAQEWDKWSRHLEWISAGRRWPVLDSMRDQLLARWPKNQPEGLVWGGAELVNVMFDEDFQVLAVMDWEQPSLGGPLNDLAWWLHAAAMKHGETATRRHLEGMGTREETIALWGEASGLEVEDIDWYEDFTALKFACLGVSMAHQRGWPGPDHSELAKRFGLAV